MLGLLAGQHVLVLSIYLISPGLIVQAAGLSAEAGSNAISLTMVGLGLAALLQIRRRGPFGCGLMVLPTAQSVFVPGSLVAARSGGMAAVAALILIAAAVEMALSRFVHRLRGLLPPELSGLIVLVTGLGIAQAGMADVLDVADGLTQGEPGRWLVGLLVAAVTLAIMVSCSVWARGAARSMGAIFGLAGGYAASLAAGLVDPHILRSLGAAPLLRLPQVTPEVPHITPVLLLPALATGLAITLNSIGALTAGQKLAEPDWKRQDMDGLARGLLADGLGAMVTALIGGTGVSASASSVGLAATARASSRAIGAAAAAGFLALSLAPKFALLVLSVPRPVLGAALVFLSCSLLISAIAIISSRLLDARKTFCLGIAFAFAAGTPALAQAGALLPAWSAPVLASPLLAAALVGILLNPVLRLGIRQQVVLEAPPGGLPASAVADFIAEAGRGWGARRDVIAQVQGAIAECLDALIDADLPLAGVRLALGFNELELDARLSWRGAALPLCATRPTKQELLTDDAASARMAGYLISRLATHVSSRDLGEERELRLRFDH
jgi:NCS2 family nucleobase:cation symporter-2